MKSFAVIGNPIAHSRSPEIHLAFAKQTGMTISYRRLEAPVTADDSGFADAVRAFFAAGGVGMNVTAPFKDAAFRLASAASERSRLAAAANTLTSDGRGSWHADNTDGIGLVRDLIGRIGLSLAGRRLLILGAGGATAGILGPLLDAQPSQVVLWNRSADKAQRLARRFAAAYPDAALETVSNLSPAKGKGFDFPFDLVIHATSLKAGAGLPEAAVNEATHEIAKAWPWLKSSCSSDTFFYDLSYADDGETLFLRWVKSWAKSQDGRRWSDGLGMLVEQAAESFRIWHNCLPETTTVFAALRAK
ncbi:MAG: shikimate dehydrogenase [Betaproteobacteria bacterium]|nr:shikimate dehydrogenase [Betaproteobacteria bacterium]